MSNFLEELKKFFEDIPQEVIFEKWAKYDTEENNVGPTVEEFLTHCHLYQLRSNTPPDSLQSFLKSPLSPKFSSGFLYI
jgi:hypothetical protein